MAGAACGQFRLCAHLKGERAGRGSPGRFPRQKAVIVHKKRPHPVTAREARPPLFFYPSPARTETGGPTPRNSENPMKVKTNVKAGFEVANINIPGK